MGDMQSMAEEIVSGGSNEDAYDALADALVERMVVADRLAQVEILKGGLKFVLTMAMQQVLVAASQEIETLKRELAQARGDGERAEAG